jgi:hypothetical protein
MNSLDYYTRQGDVWTTEEEEQLKKEYENPSLTVLHIADIHKRTPGGCAAMLKKLGLIVNRFSARGYEEYQKSNLYKEIVEKGTIKKVENQQKKKDKEQEKERVTQVMNTPAILQIMDLKEEIASLKKDVKEILRLMNALYEFEND